MDGKPLHMNGGTFDAYVRHLKSRGLRPATIGCYTGWLRRLARWAGAPPETLTAEDLERWIAAHDWAPNSHRKAVQAIQQFYRWAHATDRIDADPAAALRPSRAARAVPNPCPEPTYAQALTAATGAAYWRLRLAGDTGLRRSELAAVHSDDVFVLAAGPMLRVDGKGGVVRWVPLPADLAQWLLMQRGWAFPGPRGHLASATVGKWYKTTLGVNPHQLRHRYATLAYRRAHDINAVKDLLGHASVATTQVYVAVSGEDLRESAEGAWPDQRPALRLA